MKHFKLTAETKINALGIKLYRIECTIDCKWAKVGDKGGWVESEDNLSGNAWVGDNAWVYGDAKVYGDAWVGDNAWVYGDAKVGGNAWVYGDAKVYGDAWVSGNAKVGGDADYCAFKSFGSNCRVTTAYRNKDGGVSVVCGCFNGTLSEFEGKVKETHGDNKYAKEYLAIIEVIKIKFDIK